MTRQYLDEAAELPAGKSILAIAGAKIDNTAYYSGSDELEVLETFLQACFNWMKLYNLLNPDSASAQVPYMGTRLKDEAAKWYSSWAESTNPSDMTLEDFVVNLYNRFISVKSRSAAMEKFASLRQGTMSVIEYYTELDRLARRQKKKPDEAWIAFRFMQGLHTDLVNALANLGHNASDTELSKLVEAATQLDESKNARPSHAKLASTGKTVSASHLNARRHRDNIPYRRNDERYRPDKPVRPTQESPQKGRVAPKPAAAIAGNTGKPRPTEDAKKDITCFKCGNKGHYSSECPVRVPKAYRIRAPGSDNGDDAKSVTSSRSMRAAAIVEANDDAVDHDDELDNGSQVRPPTNIYLPYLGTCMQVPACFFQPKSHTCTWQVQVLTCLYLPK